MGTLLSLSKPATTNALEASEALLLAFGVLLVIGLVGEYSKSERWKAHVRKFEMMVIIGVAGELVADGGIFLFSAHLQTISESDVASLNKEAGVARRDAAQANLELAKLKAPRTLDSAQRQRIIAAINRFKGTRFDLAVVPFDQETDDFGAAIQSVLVSAGWIHTQSTEFGFSYELSGVGIRFAPPRRTELEPACRAIASALIAEGIKATVAAAEAGLVDNPAVINIRIGKKP
jgi:hypothetical protein